MEDNYLERLKSLWKEADMRLHCLSEIDSTNRFAKELLRENGKPVAVCALRQTAGRGRLGRRWVSPPGNLYVTFGYPAAAATAQASSFALAASLAVADALNEFGVEAGIKWPNDVYAKGGKLCGILCESVSMGGKLRYMAVGIGVNVNQTEFFGEAEKGVSVRLLTGREADTAAILLSLKRRLDEYAVRWQQQGFAGIRADYEARSILMGREVLAHIPHSVSGRCVGFSEQGDLLLQTAAGVLPIRSGEVTGKLAF